MPSIFWEQSFTCLPKQPPKKQDLTKSEKMDWNINRIYHIIQWLQFKLTHYACSKGEFEEMLLILTQKPSFVTWIMTHFYVEKRHSSRFSFFLPMEWVTLGDPSCALPRLVSQCVKPFAFHFVEDRKTNVFSMKELTTWQGSLSKLCQEEQLPFELFVRCLVWISFQYGVLDSQLNPLLVLLRYHIGHQELPNGNIKVKSRIIGCNIWDDQFSISHVLRLQTWGQLDLEDIDWYSIVPFYNHLPNPLLYVKMLRLLASIYYYLFSLSEKTRMISNQEARFN
jgi:hypothetical protein